jgi:DNA polymerase III subunit alpha
MTRSDFKYANLHTHSHYSILDGSASYKDYFELLKNTPGQYPSFAMTEHGHLIGTVDYLNTAKEYDVKPIVGMEIYMTTEQQWQDYQEDKKKTPSRYHLVIIAKNKQGYKDLVAMNNYTIKQKRVFTSRIQRWYILQTPEILAKFNKGNWIVSAACVGSFVFYPYSFDNDLKETINRYTWMKNEFGNDFYFEFQLLPIPSQKKMNEIQVKLMSRYPEQKAIVTCDAHYDRLDKDKYRDIIMSMNWKTSYKQFRMIQSKNKRESEEQMNLHFRTNEELYDEWETGVHKDIIPEEMLFQAAQNTIDIVESIEKFSLNKKQSLNTVKQYFDRDPDEIVYEKCVEGLKTRVGRVENLKDYVAVFKKEFEVVKEKKFSTYFLSVLQVINNLAEANVYRGIGRGSGGSFLINYLLGLTNIDPVKYKLMSERFLDAAREDYPDLDIDVESREDMYKIFKNTFPKHDVVLISNRNTLSAKALFKQVWRTFEIDIPVKNNHLGSADKISEHLDTNYGLRIKLEKVLEDKYILDILDQVDERHDGLDVKTLLREMYQNLSAIGVHAGGVMIIDPKEHIIPYVPTLGNKMSLFATGFCESGNLTELEQIGHIKFDMLGLGNLRCLHETINLIAKAFDTAPESVYKQIDPRDMDIRIPEVYKGFRSGFTQGIFQFASEGMTTILNKLKVQNIDELSMCNALYRPGPLGAGAHTLAIHNKHNPEQAAAAFSDEMWSYIGSILDNTYSVPVFEEQIMKIGLAIADFDPAQLNGFRKFLKNGYNIKSKFPRKFKKLTKEYRDRFMIKGEEKGLDIIELEKLWQIMEKFSSYSFNASHAISYSLLAYQTMYMSVMYPGYWYTSVLNESPKKLENVMIEIRNRVKEKDVNIQFAPAKLGNFYSDFTFVPHEEKNPFEGTIYVGLRHIKGFGDSAMEQMKQLEGTSFNKFEEFMKFLKDNKLNAVNKRALLTMANIDMFSELKISREDARALILLEKEKSKYRVVAEEIEGKRKKYRPMTLEEVKLLDKEENKIGPKYFYIVEKDAIGIAFCDNPTAHLRTQLNKLKRDPSFHGKELDAGLVVGCTEKSTKHGKVYYYVRVDSLAQKKTIGLFVWDRDWKHIGKDIFENLNKNDSVVFVANSNDWRPDTYNLKELMIIDEEEENE